MRRILIMFLFAIVIFCLGVPGARGYKLVQKASNSGGTQAPDGSVHLQVSFHQGTTAGNLIVVSAGWSNGGTASVSDDHNTPYSTAVGPPASGYASQIWYAANVVSGVTTVTIIFSGSFNDVANVFEYSGLATTSPLDVTNSNTGTSNALDTGSVTTTQANELIFATGFTASQLTGGPNFTFEQDTNWNAAEYLGAEDRTGPSGSYDGTLSAAAPNGAWVAQIATFKPTGAPGGPTCGTLDDGSTLYTPSNYKTFVPPTAKIGTYLDSDFNAGSACTVTRLTDGETDVQHPAGHNYIRSAFNADSSKFLASDITSGAFYVQDLATGTIIVAENQLQFSGSAADETWDRNNASHIYYELYQSNELKMADISACTVSSPCDGNHGTSVVNTSLVALNHDSNTPYLNLDNNNNKRDISDDGCHLAMGGYYLGSDTKYHWDAFLYNVCTGVKSPVASCVASDQTPSTQTPTQFTAGTTHSNRVWVAWGAFCNDASRTGIQLHDSNMNFIGQLFTGTPHSTAVYDPIASKEYIVFASGGEPLNTCTINSVTSSGIGAVETDVAPPFTGSCVVPLTWNLGDIHVSSNNATGWFAAEMSDTTTSSPCTSGTSSTSCTTNDNSTLPTNWNATGVWGHLYNEVIAANISTGQIYRLAHSRSRLTGATPCGGYYAQPRISMDFSGTRIAFDSSMAKTNSPLPACVQDYVDAYMIKFR